MKRGLCETLGCKFGQTNGARPTTGKGLLGALNLAVSDFTVEGKEAFHLDNIVTAVDELGHLVNDVLMGDGFAFALFREEAQTPMIDTEGLRGALGPYDLATVTDFAQLKAGDGKFADGFAKGGGSDVAAVEEDVRTD
jgi:hypothetical protein